MPECEQFLALYGEALAGQTRAIAELGRLEAPGYLAVAKPTTEYAVCLAQIRNDSGEFDTFGLIACTAKLVRDSLETGDEVLEYERKKDALEEIAQGYEEKADHALDAYCECLGIPGPTLEELQEEILQHLHDLEVSLDDTVDEIDELADALARAEDETLGAFEDEGDAAMSSRSAPLPDAALLAGSLPSLSREAPLA